MTKHEQAKNFSRRTLLKAGGALVVSIGAPVTFDTAHAADSATAVAAKPPLMPDQLSSYITVNADGTVSAYFGKMDMGQGLSVAIKQMIAEELDVPYASMKIFMATLIPASIRAAPQARPASRRAASRCAWPPPRRAACWSTWRPRNSAFRPANSR